MFSDVVTRILAVVQTLASAHLQLAQQEASRDLSRIISGAVALLLAFVLLFTSWIAVNGLGVLLLIDFGLTPIVSLSILFGGNLLIAIVLLLVGMARLKRPVLKETRGLLRKTAHSLTS